MKYLILLILLTFLGIEGYIHKDSEFVKRIRVPYYLAQLAKEEPEQSIFMPIVTIKKSEITNTFGGPRSGGRKHEGQDIFAKRGTPIFSATDGVVIRVGENRLGGKTVSVIGKGGRRYYYAHLDSYGPIEVGDKISTTTNIGFVGTTGNASGTPPHLHFGVYNGMEAIDPLILLQNR